MSQDTKKIRVFLTPEFIRDLQESKHPNMAKQALSHVFDDKGDFKVDREDHQYKGMVDAWIRWVQMGGPGLRVIYIRKGDDIYLYRTVGKSDESGLSNPAQLLGAAAVDDLPKDILLALGEGADHITPRLLKTTATTFLRDAIRSMYHVPHQEIYLVSPSVSQPLFRVSGELGRFLDRAIEDGTRCVLVTLPPAASEIEFYEDLARRQIEVYFIQNLRSRLFLFGVDEYRLGKGIHFPRTAMLGSAELTYQSLDMGEIRRHEELCYRFPETHFPAFKNYAETLVKRATDLQGHKMSLLGA